MKRISIVIPAYKPLSLLIECIECIKLNTTLDDVEIIVVCNGSERPTMDYLVKNHVTFLWYDDPIGFTKAANLGFNLAYSKYTIIMNTDAHIMGFEAKDVWINKLLKPFEDPRVGITGLGGMWTKYGMYVPFYCSAIRSNLFEEIGYLDERFNPGYAEDADFCYRARKAGYETVIVDKVTPPKDTPYSSTDFPIFHKGEQSFTDKVKREEYVSKGHALLEEIWGSEVPLKDIYLELGTSPIGYADKGTAHTYLDYYTKVLGTYRYTASKVLEIGIYNGHSINMWAKYFDKAHIIGVDILDRNVECSDCTLVYGDATLDETFTSIGNLDVIIDDGSHNVEDQIKTFHILFPRLNVGGIYIIEDIQNIDKDWQALLELHHSAKVIDLRGMNGRYDNLLIEIRKPYG